MKINRNNYEEYFLDFFEGRLNTQLTNELMQFLDLNYDLKEEFDSFEIVTLPPQDNIIFKGKEPLKKTSSETISKENYYEMMIAAMEGDLSQQQYEELKKIISNNPSLKKEWELFERTRLSPDNSIVFENKAEIKKPIIIPYSFINKNNYKEYMIAKTEGDLDASSLKNFSAFMALNPELKSELIMFEQVKLVPDTKIIFESKEELYQPVKAVPIYKINPFYNSKKKLAFRLITYPIYAAASILIVLTVYFTFFNNEVLQTVPESAETNPANIKPLINNKHSQMVADNIINEKSAEVNKNKKNRIEYELDKPQMMASIEIKPLKQAPVIYPESIEPVSTYSELFAKISSGMNEDLKKENVNEHYYTLDNYAVYFIKKSLTSKNERKNIKPDDKLSLWDLADAGLRGVNNITGANAKLVRKKDASYTLALGDKFSYTHSGSKH